MDLSKLSIAELRSLQDKVKLEMKQREHHDLAQAREQILAIAHKVGIPLKELAAGVRVKSGSGPVAVRYRNPGDSAQQWTGRGRQPKWVKAWVDAGKSLDLLRV